MYVSLGIPIEVRKLKEDMGERNFQGRKIKCSDIKGEIMDREGLNGVGNGG